MNFNFNDATSFVSDSTQYLKPYNIHKVHLTKLELTQLNGKDGTVYPVVAIEFAGDEGIFSENIFIPRKEEDFTRNENSTSHKLMPSGFDKLQYTVMQIVQVLNPTGAEKIQEAVKKWPAADSVNKAIEYINKFVLLASQAVSKCMTTDVYLKLIGKTSNGKVYARLPNSCFIMDGKPVASNFISKDSTKLYFSSWEDQQSKAIANAKPTEMDSSVDATSVDLDDITFD